MPTAASLVEAYPVFLLLAFMLGAVALWRFWQLSIRPMMIPRTEIERRIEELRSEYGDDMVAELMARLDHAQRYGDADEEGEVQRLLREIRRKGCDNR